MPVILGNPPQKTLFSRSTLCSFRCSLIRSGSRIALKCFWYSTLTEPNNQPISFALDRVSSRLRGMTGASLVHVESVHEKLPQTPVLQLRRCDRTRSPLHHLQPSIAAAADGLGQLRHPALPRRPVSVAQSNPKDVTYRKAKKAPDAGSCRGEDICFRTTSLILLRAVAGGNTTKGGLRG